jgi:hypothetical protein
LKKGIACLAISLLLLQLGSIFSIQLINQFETGSSEEGLRSVAGQSNSTLPESFTLGNPEKITPVSLASSSSYPSTLTWMEKKVPYYSQGVTNWCGFNSLLMVFTWWGMKVDIFDLADKFDWHEGLEKHEFGLEEIHEALTYFMNPTYDDTYGDGDKETLKSWIYRGAPVICTIRHPASGDGDEADHAVVLFGWDDSRNGGSWLMHDPDPNSWFSINNQPYDIWVRYESFNEHWNKEWKWSIFGGSRKRGYAVAIPGDGKYPKPFVRVIQKESALDSSTFTYEIQLENQARTDKGEGDHGFSGGKSHGVHIRLSGAEFVGVDKGSFDSYQAYTPEALKIDVSGAEILELYSDFPLSIKKGFNTCVGRFTIRPTSAYVKLFYRGWMMDEDDRAFWGSPRQIDDDRPRGLSSSLMNPTIVRYPDDALTQPDFRDYFTECVSLDLIENPELTSPSHEKGRPSSNQILTIEWETPYVHGGVGGYSYTVVSQDDPYYDVNRMPDDVIDLDASATSFKTQPLEPGHVWEFNIKTISLEGWPANFYSSFWVDIESHTVAINRPRSGDIFEVGEWVNVFWDGAVEWGGHVVGAGYIGYSIDLFKGPLYVRNLVPPHFSNIDNYGFRVPDVDPASDYNLRIILEKDYITADKHPELPERFVGFSEFFSIVNPQGVLDVSVSDPEGDFAVVIDAGADKGEPVTSWTEISTTNILAYDLELSSDGLVITINGQLADPNQEGHIILEVDPEGKIITYEIGISIIEKDTVYWGIFIVALLIIVSALAAYILFRKLT